ncbi:IS66 family transposase, partial [Marinibactrum halimedae]
MKTVAALQQEITLLRQALAAEKEKNSFLSEQIQHLLRQRFAPSSEKTPPNQLGLFNEAEVIEAEETELTLEETATEVKSHTRTRKPRVSIPDNLPREDIIYDLPEHDKTCPHDGAALKNIGSEDHEQLEIIPAKIKVIRHRRLKYACPCCDQHIVTASKPKQPIEKSIASPSLLAFIATQKYADALPLYRQSEMFKRIGIHLDRTNMANWMIQCGKLVQPLINLLIEHLHQQPLLHMDETTLQVLDEPGKNAQSKSYMWVMNHTGSHSASVFHYADHRGQQVPLELLSSDTHAIMVDGYEGYQKACNDYG